MTILTFFILSIAVSLFVVYPIVQTKRGVGFKDSSNHRARDLEDRKEAIYAAIKDIEFDYQMGKLSEEDFKELRQQYKDEAVGLLQKIDQIQKTRFKSKKIHAAKKQQIKSDSKEIKFCWICGTAVTKSDKFCINCGNKLK
jgi:cytochrome c-type biogenesis protein CcmH/NrfG